MSQLISVVIGSAGAVVVSLLANWFTRRRTSAEADRAIAEATHHGADAVNSLAQATVDLIPHYQSQIDGLSVRLVAAEAAADFARRLSMSARESEQRCLDRMDKMQAQLNTLQELVNHPPTTQEPGTT